MFSPVASTIFTFRNIDKTENGEIGRAPVALGQAVGVLGEIAKYDNAAALTAKNMLSVFSDLSKENKVMNYAGKFAKFASNNVNPLIALSGGVKVLMSDDKQSAAITETAALSAMFGGEALVKKHYDKILNSKNMQQLLTSASKQKYLKPVFEFLKKKNWGGATGAIIKGLIFLAASMSAYEVGHIAGDKIVQKVKTKQSEQQKIDDETLNQVIKTLMANNENIEENEKINHVA